MDGHRPAHDEWLQHVALDLSDDGDQDQYKQRDQRTAAGQRDDRGDGQRDRGADDRDEGREEDQQGQRQGQRHAQPQQRQADQQGVRCGDDDDAPGVPGESLPSRPTGDVDLGPHGAWSLPEEPGPHPVTAVDEEDRAEHREREPGEYLQGEAGLAQRLAYQGRLMPRDPQPGLVHRPAELRRAQVQRSPTQPLVDLVDPVAQLGTKGRGLAGHRRGDEGEHARHEYHAGQHGHRHGQCPGQHELQPVGNRPQQRADHEPDEDRDTDELDPAQKDEDAVDGDGDGDQSPGVAGCDSHAVPDVLIGVAIRRQQAGRRRRWDRRSCLRYVGSGWGNGRESAGARGVGWCLAGLGGSPGHRRCCRGCARWVPRSSRDAV